MLKYTSKIVLFASIFKHKRDTLLKNYKSLSSIHPSISKPEEKTIQDVPGGMCQTSGECSLS